MRPGQDSSVLTELGQLSPEAVSVPGHLFELSGQPFALLLYGDEFTGLRGERHRAWRREGTLQGWRHGAIDLLLQEGWRADREGQKGEKVDLEQN